MKKIIFATFLFVLVSGIAIAQKKKPGAVDNFVDVTAGIGSSQFTGALAYVYNWKVGKRKRWEAGPGRQVHQLFWK